MQWITFQFLYSTIKGSATCSGGLAKCKFQFLYSTIKGILLVNNQVLFLIFQFLYSTIKGCTAKFIARIICQISIPV